MHDPVAIDHAPEFRATPDPRRPVVLIVVGAAHFALDEDDAIGVVRRLLEPPVPGSCPAMSVGTDDFTPGEMHRVAREFAAHGMPVRLRARAGAQEFFAGLELVAPGLSQVHHRRPDAAGSSGHRRPGHRPVRGGGPQAVTGDGSAERLTDGGRRRRGRGAQGAAENGTGRSVARPERTGAGYSMAAATAPDTAHRAPENRTAGNHLGHVERARPMTVADSPTAQPHSRATRQRNSHAAPLSGCPRTVIGWERRVHGRCLRWLIATGSPTPRGRHTPGSGRRPGLPHVSRGILTPARPAHLVPCPPRAHRTLIRRFV